MGDLADLVELVFDLIAPIIGGLLESLSEYWPIGSSRIMTLDLSCSTRSPIDCSKALPGNPLLW